MKFFPLVLLSFGSAFQPFGATTSAAVSTIDHAAEIAALEKKLGAAREEITELKTALAVARAQAQAAEARAQSVSRPEPEVDSLRGQVRILERDLQSATVALKRVVAEKAAAESALESANQQLAEAAKKGPVARPPSAPAASASAAGMEPQLAELRSALNEARLRLSQTEREFAAKGAELANLRAALAVAEARPAATADELQATRRSLAEMEQRLTAVTAELADTRRELATTRELDRLRQLEAEQSAYLYLRDESRVSGEEMARVTAAREEAEQKLAAAAAARVAVEKERDELRARVAKVDVLEARIRELESQPPGVAAAPPGAGVSQEEYARVAAARVDAESKLATALRSYTLLTRERDQLRARVADLTAKLSAAPEQR